MLTSFHYVTYHKIFHTSIKFLTFLEKGIDILIKLEYDAIVLRNLETEVRENEETKQKYNYADENSGFCNIFDYYNLDYFGSY